MQHFPSGTFFPIFNFCAPTWLQSFTFTPSIRSAMSPFEFLKTIEKCLSLVSQLLLGCYTSECIYAPIAQVPNAQETPASFIYEHTVALDDAGQLARRQFANLGNIPGAPVFVADCREVFPRPVPAELEAEGEGMGILREKGQDKEDRTEEEGDAGEGVGEVFEHFGDGKGGWC